MEGTVHQGSSGYPGDGVRYGVHFGHFVPMRSFKVTLTTGAGPWRSRIMCDEPAFPSSIIL